jgi:hypothetical protein
MTIEARLINWGRWCRESMHYGHCGSIEHQYRSPQCWYPPEPKPEPLDLLDGQLIERQVRALHVKHRDILRLRYAKRYNWIALNKKYKHENVRDLLMFAEIELKERLIQHEAGHTVSANSNTLAISLLRAALAA